MLLSQTRNSSGLEGGRKSAGTQNRWDLGDAWHVSVLHLWTLSNVQVNACPDLEQRDVEVGPELLALALGEVHERLLLDACRDPERIGQMLFACFAVERAAERP